jgi:hypothetical protein
MADISEGALSAGYVSLGTAVLYAMPMEITRLM